MDRAQVIEGAAAAEIVALDERDGQPALGRIAGNRQAVDAAADDEHVEGLRGRAPMSRVMHDSELRIV